MVILGSRESLIQGPACSCYGRTVHRVRIATVAHHAAMCNTINTSAAGQVAPGPRPGNNRSGIIDVTSTPNAMRRYRRSGLAARRAITANTSTPPETRTAVKTISACHLSGTNSGDRSTAADAMTRTASTATIAATTVNGPTHQRRRSSTPEREAAIVTASSKTLETTDQVQRTPDRSASYGMTVAKLEARR